MKSATTFWRCYKTDWKCMESGMWKIIFAISCLSSLSCVQIERTAEMEDCWRGHLCSCFYVCCKNCISRTWEFLGSSFESWLHTGKEVCRCYALSQFVPRWSQSNSMLRTYNWSAMLHGLRSLSFRQWRDKITAWPNCKPWHARLSCCNCLDRCWFVCTKRAFFERPYFNTCAQLPYEIWGPRI